MDYLLIEVECANARRAIVCAVGAVVGPPSSSVKAFLYVKRRLMGRNVGTAERGGAKSNRIQSLWFSEGERALKSVSVAKDLTLRALQRRKATREGRHAVAADECLRMLCAGG